MSENIPDLPDQGEHGEDLEFARYQDRIDFLHGLAEQRDIALTAEERLGLLDGRSLLTQKFIIKSVGQETYDFPHQRIKLNPKNRANILPITSALVRFPSEGNVQAAFITWFRASSQPELFYLDEDEFSRLEKAEGSFYKRFPARQSDYEDLRILINNFEPSPQDNSSDVA